MTTVAVAAAQTALAFATGSGIDSSSGSYADEAIKAHNRLSQSSNQSSASKRSKTRIGPWRLGRTLGRGSSGRVRLAKHAITGQLAAVKIVPKTLPADDNSGHHNNNDPISAEAAVAAAAAAAAPGGEKGKDAGGLPYGIEREVIIMKLIEHPNVMALYDVWENKGELYLVLEYVEGGELFDYLIKKGRLDEREAINYFRQIIYGVDYCHRFNICHRDLKPENLLLDKNRNIKIADFGMAALETSDRMLETSCGSPHYASPEIVAGKNYHGAPSDIWSCGVILFALLTGHLPFDDDNIRKLLLKVQTGRFMMPNDISAEAQDLIWKMLRVDPNKRISMSEILRHPLLKKYPPKRGNHHPRHHHPINPNFANADRPVKSASEIDSEILKNLQILWHGAPKEAVIEKLMAPGPNSEKTFYCLLMKYRHDHIQDNVSGDSRDTRNSNSRSKTERTTERSLGGHHRKRSSQTSLNKRASIAGINTTTITTTTGHSRNGSRSSVITASSSHRRNVAFVRKKGSSSHLRPISNSGTSTPQQHHQRQSSLSPGAAVESLAIPRARRSAAAGTPDDDFNFIDKRASVELATMCEQAFFSTVPQQQRSETGTESSSIVSSSTPLHVMPTVVPPPSRYARMAGGNERVMSDPLSSARSVRSAATPEKRAFSLGEHETGSVEPGSRPFSAYSTVSEVSTTSTATQPYFLPMIFEEDRFADAIEEEVDLKIYKRPSSRVEGDEDEYVFFSRPATVAMTQKRVLVAPNRPILSPREPNTSASAATPTIASSSPTAVVNTSGTNSVLTTKESSRLQIAGLVKTESFKIRSHTGFAAYRTPSTKQQQVNNSGNGMKNDDVKIKTTGPVLPISPPASPPLPNVTSAAGNNNNNKANIPTKATISSIPNKPVAFMKSSTPALTPATKLQPTAAAPPSTRKPLAPRTMNDRNIMITSNDVNTKKKGDSYGEANPNKTSAASSLFRKLTLAPRRPPPPPPPPPSVQKPQSATGVSPVSQRQSSEIPSLRTASGKSSKSNEVKQNWFMKMLNPQPSSYSNGSNGFNSRGSAGSATKTLFSTTSVTTMRHIIVEVLEDWQKYGISHINEDAVTSTVTAVISSRNVLSMRSSKFRINVYPMPGGTRAVFTQEKGSSSSFLRFLGELERALGEMNVLSPPRTDPRVAIGVM